MQNQNRNRNGAKTSLVVIGGINMDFLVRGETLPKPGETIDGKTFQQGVGGKGANQAVAAARLGMPTTLIARLGDDEHGTLMLNQLNVESIDTQFITNDENEATGVALIMVEEEGQKQIMTAPGANYTLSPLHLRATENLIKGADAVLMQLEVPLDTIKAAAKLAHDAGVKVFLDPAPAVPLTDELLKLIDVIKPNSAEAEVLTDIAVKDQSSARKAAKQLQKRGVGIVAIEAGEEGNLLVWEDTEHFYPRLEVDSVDATGAGDAFIAALTVAIIQGYSVLEAGHIANTAAALATTKLGAQAALPRWEDIEALYSPAT